MSSVARTPSVTKQGNDFFINGAAIDTTNGDLFAYNESAGTIAAAASVAGLDASYAAGALLVKDLGKTVTVEGARYRKAQAFNSERDDTSFYILLNPASGLACKWARMTLQA